MDGIVGDTGMHQGATERESVSEGIVTTVAEAADVEPRDLPPLYDAIDPDALDEVVRPTVTPGGGSSITVAFTYAGYSVTICEGEISLTER